MLFGVSFLVAHSGAAFLSSIINKMIMPIVEVILGEESREQASVLLGDVKIMWGAPLSDGLHFAVVIYIVVITHKYLKKRKPE